MTERNNGTARAASAADMDMTKTSNGAAALQHHHHHHHHHQQQQQQQQQQQVFLSPDDIRNVLGDIINENDLTRLELYKQNYLSEYQQHVAQQHQHQHQQPFYNHHYSAQDIAPIFTTVNHNTNNTATTAAFDSGIDLGDESASFSSPSPASSTSSVKSASKGSVTGKNGGKHRTSNPDAAASAMAIDANTAALIASIYDSSCSSPALAAASILASGSSNMASPPPSASSVSSSPPPPSSSSSLLLASLHHHQQQLLLKQQLQQQQLPQHALPINPLSLSLSLSLSRGIKREMEEDYATGFTHHSTNSNSNDEDPDNDNDDHDDHDDHDATGEGEQSPPHTSVKAKSSSAAPKSTGAGAGVAIARRQGRVSKSTAAPAAPASTATATAVSASTQQSSQTTIMGPSMPFQWPTPLNPDLEVRVLGLPKVGAKSRVETQMKLCVQLVSRSTGNRVYDYKHVFIPVPMLSREPASKSMETFVRNNVSVRPDTLVLHAAVVCSSDESRQVLACNGCIQREIKRACRRKDTAITCSDYNGEPVPLNSVTPETLLFHQRRVLLFNSASLLDFESGEVHIPTRITCYCRHHNELSGFVIVFWLTDWQSQVVAAGRAPCLLITDDHKSAKARSLKKVKTSAEDDEDEEQPFDEGNSSPFAGKADSDAVSSAGTAAPEVKEKGRRPSRQAVSRTASNLSSKSTDASGSGASVFSVAAAAAAAQSFASPHSLVTSPASDVSNSAHTAAGSWSQSVSAVGSPLPSPRTTALAASVASVPALHGSLVFADGSGAPALSSMDLELQAQTNQAMLLSQLMQFTGAQVDDLPLDVEQYYLQNESNFHSLHKPTASPSSTVSMGAATPSPRPSQAPLPTITRIIPTDGPLCGGVECTVLGTNFAPGNVCVFGDVEANPTHYWGPNTLVCVVPPAVVPGAVPVTIRGNPISFAPDEPVLFTYRDDTDRALMELALQVLGLKMTGKLENAKHVALQIVSRTNGVSSASSSSSSSSTSAMSGNTGTGTGTDALPSADTAAVVILARVLASDARISPDFSSTDFESLLILALAGSLLLSPSRPLQLSLMSKSMHTLLHFAVLKRFYNLTSFLVRFGAKMDAQDVNGYTALHFAACMDDKKMVRLLVRAGSATDIETRNGLLAADLTYDESIRCIIHPPLDSRLGMEDDDGAGDASDSDSLSCVSSIFDDGDDDDSFAADAESASEEDAGNDADAEEEDEDDGSEAGTHLDSVPEFLPSLAAPLKPSTAPVAAASASPVICIPPSPLAFHIMQSPIVASTALGRAHSGDSDVLLEDLDESVSISSGSVDDGSPKDAELLMEEGKYHAASASLHSLSTSDAPGVSGRKRSKKRMSSHARITDDKASSITDEQLWFGAAPPKAAPSVFHGDSGGSQIISTAPSVLSPFLPSAAAASTAAEFGLDTLGCKDMEANVDACVFLPLQLYDKLQGRVTPPFGLLNAAASMASGSGSHAVSVTDGYTPSSYFAGDKLQHTRKRDSLLYNFWIPLAFVVVSLLLWRSVSVSSGMPELPSFA